MKKYLFILIISLLSISASAATDSSFLNNDSGVKFLKVGSFGPAVSALQAYLVNQGLYNKKVDGKFGPGTKSAVIAYQKLAGLVPDGSAGPHTFKFMNIYPGIKLSTANNKTLTYLRSLYQTQNQNLRKASLNPTAQQVLNSVLTVASKPTILALSSTNQTQSTNTGIDVNSTGASQLVNNSINTNSSINISTQSQNLSFGQNTSQLTSGLTQNLTQNFTNTGAATSSPVYYLNGNNILATTTTPWWQSNTITTNYNNPNASIPLSGYPFEFKISADAVFTLYSYKIGANGKVADLQPICKNMNVAIYGIPTWKNYKKCTKFTLPQDYNLALAVGDNGVTAGAWIGTIEIIGNKYYSQDYAWRYVVSNSTITPNTKDFSTTQISNEINTGTFRPTEVIGFYGTDPWGVFIEDENDHSFDEAAWIKAVEPGLKKIAIYTLQNGGVAIPNIMSEVDLKAEGVDTLSIDAGESFSLYWTNNNVSTCFGTSSPNKASWNTAHEVAAGSATINGLNVQTTFTINCTNANGIMVSDSVVVSIKPTLSLTSSTNANGTTKITWITTNVTACKSTGGSSGWATTGYSRPASGNWDTQAALTSDTTFSIDCSGPGGSISESVIVTVQQGPDPVITLSADPNPVTNGSTTLTWSTTNMNGSNPCTATSSPVSTWTGQKVASGSIVINNLTQDTIFQLSCTNTVGQFTLNSVFVTVQNADAPKVLSITKVWDSGNFPKSMIVTVNFSKPITIQSPQNVLPVFKIVSTGATGYSNESTPYTGTDIFYVFGNLSADPGAFKFNLPLPTGTTVVDAANPSVHADLTGQWQ